MATAADFIKFSLRKINAYQPGDPLNGDDAADGLEVFNDLLGSWSAQKQYVFGSQEFIFQWIANQKQYKLGNPLCTDIGEPPFLGTVTGSSNIITSVTNVPADLVFGASLTDIGGVIPSGTTVTAVGANTVTMSANATASYSGVDSITYSIPGDFAMPRPLRITHGYTRFSNLDFPLDVYATESEYNAILYKVQPGPWPTIAWYNPVMPYGLLNVYQMPGNNAEAHLFCDTILGNLSLTSTIIMPQPYARGLKWCLARELWPEYWGSKPFPPHMEKLAYEGERAIKALNAQPVPKMGYEPILTKRRHDKGFIFRGY